jgi:RimJ/RimL family protein N-acetyltransferase
MTGRPPAEVLALRTIVLRRWRLADAPELSAEVSASLEHLRPWLAWADRHDPVAAAGFLAETEAGWRRGVRFEYAIRDAREGALLGGVGLLERIGPGGLEIGYWVGTRWVRRGIASAAAALVSEAALALPGVTHVEIHHDEANVASAGVPAGLGFRRIGAFPAERLAPAESGREVRWRMPARGFPASPAGSLLARGRP